MSKLESAVVGAFVAILVPACACAASAFLELRDPFAGADLARMFGLKSAATRPMILGLVAIGGLALVACQYRLATKAAHVAFGGNTGVETHQR